MSKAKNDFLNEIDNLKYEIDELRGLAENINFIDINEIWEFLGKVDAIHILLNDLISFCYEREYLDEGNDEK
jgi:hypothetical protein